MWPVESRAMFGEELNNSDDLILFGDVESSVLGGELVGAVDLPRHISKV
ncbi:MAG: hypothetical protein OXG55_15800 [bacterium]|nr:hypothetical protein [bacterium]